MLVSLTEPTRASTGIGLALVQFHALYRLPWVHVPIMYLCHEGACRCRTCGISPFAQLAFLSGVIVGKPTAGDCGQSRLHSMEFSVARCRPQLPAMIRDDDRSERRKVASRMALSN
jgi:hypothetical protein